MMVKSRGGRDGLLDLEPSSAPLQTYLRQLWTTPAARSDARIPAHSVAPLSIASRRDKTPVLALVRQSLRSAARLLCTPFKLAIPVSPVSMQSDLLADSDWAQTAPIAPARSVDSLFSVNSIDRERLIPCSRCGVSWTDSYNTWRTVSSAGRICRRIASAEGSADQRFVRICLRPSSSRLSS